MKRLITISIICLVVIGIILGGSWLFSRRSAQKNGTTPQSFREFVTGDTGSGTNQGNTPGDLSSDFTTDPTQQPGTGSPGTTDPNTPGTPGGTTPPGSSNTANTRTSIFTENTLSPAPQTPSQNDPTQTGSGLPLGGTSGGTPTNNTPITPPVSVPSTTAPVAVCTDADLTITFTASELQKLQALQDRFYEVATTLHNDADVQTQLANYNALKSKLDRYRELNRYCVNSLAPKIATLRVSDFAQGVSSTGEIAGLYDDGSGQNNNGRAMNVQDAYKNKVPTPFWFDVTQIRLAPRPPVASILSLLQTQDQFSGVSNFTTQMQTIEQIRQQQANGGSATLTAEQIALEQQVQAAISSGILGVDSIPVGYLHTIGQAGGDVGACQGYDCPTIFRRTMESFLRLNLW